MLFDTNSHSHSLTLSLSLSLSLSLVLSFTLSFTLPFPLSLSLYLSISLSLYLYLSISVHRYYCKSKCSASLLQLYFQSLLHRNMHAEYFEHTIGRFEIRYVSRWSCIMQHPRESNFNLKKKRTKTKKYRETKHHFSFALCIKR